MGSVLTLPHSRVQSLVYASCNLEDKQTTDRGSNWDEIHTDIMEMIIKRLDIADRLRICNVCKAWRSIALRKDIRCRPQLPWMVLPRSSNVKYVSFFDMSQGKVYEFNIPKPIQGGWSLGSSKGWLVIARRRKSKPQIYLYNPISGVHIQLPPITTIPSFYHYLEYIRKPYNFASFIYKIELSSEDALTCTISAIFDEGKVLAICRAGEKTWNVFPKLDDNHLYLDILFSNGMLYVLYTGGSVLSNFIIELPSCLVNLKLIPIIRPPTMIDIEHLEDFSIVIDGLIHSYLVESNGDLLVVDRIYNYIASKLENDANDNDGDDETPNLTYLQTSKFAARKINSCSDTLHTCKLDFLDDQVLFLGGGSSLSISTRDFNNFKGNCIYFLTRMDYEYTDHDPLVCRESGVFFFDDGRIKRSCPSINHPMQMMYWFTPHPW